MKIWKMKSSDFYEILESQNYRCNVTGWDLTPGNTRIAHILPIKHGGKHTRSNVQVVHASIANLVREVEPDDLLNICRAVVTYSDFKKAELPDD